MKPSQRLDAITGLRFFAAAAIVIVHLPGTFGITYEQFQGYSLAQGVSVFFVLSGFVLRYSYPAISTRSEVRRFLVNRIARIWPAHVTMLLLAVVLLPGFDPGAFLANVFLVHAWVPQSDYFFSYNAVSWSISAEMGFYLLFPVLLYKFRQYPGIIIATCLLIALCMVYISVLLDLQGFTVMNDEVVLQGVLHTNPLARLFEFTVGMGVAQLWLSYRDRLSMNAALWSAIELAAVLLLLSNITLLMPILRSIFPHSLAMEAWLSTCVSPVLPTAILLFALATNRGVVSKALSYRPVRFAGELSFSIYLVHQLMLVFFRDGPMTALPVPVQLVFYVGTVLSVSCALYFIVEGPCRDFLKRLYEARYSSVRL